MAMAKIRPMNRFFLLTSRQYRFVETENVKVQSKGLVAQSGNLKPEFEKPENVFWMKDPVTGYWIPENNFGKISVVELREKLLSKKQNLS